MILLLKSSGRKWMLALLCASLAASASADREYRDGDQLGLTPAQIISMGLDKWVAYAEKKVGFVSHADRGNIEYTYHTLQRHYNERRLRTLAQPDQTRIQDIVNVASQLRKQVDWLVYIELGGGNGMDPDSNWRFSSISLKSSLIGQAKAGLKPASKASLDRFNKSLDQRADLWTKTAAEAVKEGRYNDRYAEELKTYRAAIQSFRRLVPLMQKRSAGLSVQALTLISAYVQKS